MSQVVVDQRISNLKVECQRHHIQRIFARKNVNQPSQMFNMYSNDNIYIMQDLEFQTHDVIFVEAVQDFLWKVRVLAQRTDELHLTRDQYNQMINVTINERNREELWTLRTLYEELFRTHAVLYNNTIFSMHPLMRFASVTHLLRKWTYFFKKDTHMTKNRAEFYAKMKLNAIKDSIGYMLLFYYYYDAAKFYPNMTFNMPRYRAALYKRIEQEMPYVKPGEYF
ncbi:hypothetical protein CBL_10204 [Carabus blaptoides fortunei]